MQTKRTYQIGDINTQKGFFETLIRLLDSKRMTCLPAIVERFDRQSNMALVKPLVQFMVSTDAGEVPIDRPPCTVPVFQICRGGYMIDLPLFKGDTGLLIAMDRNSSTARAANSFRLWEEQNDEDEETVKNTGATPPDGFIYTSFEFGVFMPMAFGSSNLPMGINPVTLEPVPEEGIVIKRMMNPKPNDELPIEKQVHDSRAINIKMDNDGLLVESSGGNVKLDKDGVRANSGGSTVNISGGVISVDVMTEDKEKANEEREANKQDPLPPSVVVNGESVTVSSSNRTNISSVTIKPDQIDLKIGEDDIVQMRSDGLKYIGTNTTTETVITDGKVSGNSWSSLKFEKKTRDLIKFGDFVVGTTAESDWIESVSE